MYRVETRNPEFTKLLKEVSGSKFAELDDVCIYLCVEEYDKKSFCNIVTSESEFQYFKNEGEWLTVGQAYKRITGKELPLDKVYIRVTPETTNRIQEKMFKLGFGWSARKFTLFPDHGGECLALKGKQICHASETFYVKEGYRRIVEEEIEVLTKPFDFSPHQYTNYWCLFSMSSSQYLLSDGKPHSSPCADGVMSGLYQDREAAEKILNKYKPKSKVSDLKFGDRFIWTSGTEQYKLEVLDTARVNLHETVKLLAIQLPARERLWAFYEVDMNSEIEITKTNS